VNAFVPSRVGTDSLVSYMMAYMSQMSRFPFTGFSLVTRSTGFFGQIAGMPIAAGNLFIGSFDVSNAMSNIGCFSYSGHGVARISAGPFHDDFISFAFHKYIVLCLSLVTRSTGFFGQIAGMPIAAGNLFIGSFDVSTVLATPVMA